MAVARFTAIPVTVISLLGISSRAFAEGVFSLDIPVQPLRQAIDLFSAQTHTNFLVPEQDFIGSRTSAALRGTVTMEEGLRQLLAGTGVSFEMVNDHTVILRQERREVSGWVGPVARPGRTGKAAAVDEIEEVTVTGTQLRGFKPEALPVSVYDRVEIERSGAGSLAAFSNGLIENFPLITAETFLNNGRQTQATANQGRGNAFSFFGLPSLTLVDGQRLPAAGSAGGSFVDIAGIPLSAVSDMTVLLGDVSAIYGSDAVGGATNISLRDNLEGAETLVRYGFTSRGGAAQRTISQLFGSSWGAGRAMVDLEYDHQLPLEAGERLSVPAQPGEFLIWPEQRRTGVVATLRQRLSDSTNFRANFIYSNRSFQQSSSTFLRLQSRAFATRATGEVELIHSAFSLTHELAGWRSTLLGNLGEQTESVENVSKELGSSVEAEQGFDTRSKFAAADLHLQSPDFVLWDRDVKGMIGIAARQEKFDDDSKAGSIGAGLRRDVYSVFTEVSAPLVDRSRDELRPQRLDLSLAARFDRYRDVNFSTNLHSFDPKAGLAWSPYERLRFRGTWGTSFSTPTLTHTSEAGNSALQIPLRDPTAPDESSVVLLLSGGNASLKPERSESYTLGVDWHSALVPGLQLALTYFSIDFTDQIGRPLQTISPADALVKLRDAPFITLQPTVDAVHELYGRYAVTDSTGTGEDGVEVVVDDRFTNLSSVAIEGVEFSGSSNLGVSSSRIIFDFKANYLFGVHYVASTSAESVDLVDTEFNPVDFRGWARAVWKRGSISAFLRFNFVDSYHSTKADMPFKVNAWFTTDAQIGYEPVVNGLALNLTIQNLADKPAPGVSASALGYDPTHASILGRTMSLQVSKRW